MQYMPDYLVTPGEVLDEYIDSLNMTQAELSSRTGLAKKTINEIIKGKSQITHDTAYKFELVLGRPAHFWNNLESQYQENKVRIEEIERMKENYEWMSRVPVKQMIKQGWIKSYNTKSEQLEEVLRFFGVASPAQWKVIWEDYQVAYRQTKSFETCAESVSAWLRKGEIDARSINCEIFDTKKFQDILIKIRQNLIEMENPNSFIMELTGLCASAGVAVVFIPELLKTGVYGATRWLGDTAIIQLSLRYKSNDHLWFTFFHEAGHIIKHGKKEIFIESGKSHNEKETEANDFASEKLIPGKELRNFLRINKTITLSTIKNFAAKIGVAPGIVVGRLQYDGVLSKNIGNKLKVFYTWK